MRASLLVILTRHATMSDINLLTPLWPPKDHKARHDCILKYMKAQVMDDDLVQELERLDMLQQQTTAKYSDLIAADTDIAEMDFD